MKKKIILLCSILLINTVGLLHAQDSYNQKASKVVEKINSYLLHKYEDEQWLCYTLWAWDDCHQDIYRINTYLQARFNNTSSIALKKYYFIFSLKK